MQKNSRIISFITLVINLVFIFQWVFIAVIITSFVLVLSNAYPALTEKISGLTIYFSVIDFGNVTFEDGISRNVILTNGSGRLHIESMTLNAIYLKMLGAILEALVFIYIVYLLKRIFRNLRAGNFFIRENGVFITKIGLSIILITFFIDVFNYFVSNYVSKTLAISNIEFKPFINFHFNLIFLGLLILAIAQIFIKGTEMKIEQDLTI